MLVLDGNASNLRFFYGKDVAKAYGSQVGLLLRLLVSLRASGTSLPVHVLVSGYRVPAVEARLATLGVTILEPDAAPPVRVPAWGSKWARSSFAKLRVLALTRFRWVLLLDTDSIVLSSLDHLPAAADGPAFVFGYKCFPRRELRASTAVLRPSDDAWRRASQLLDEPGTAIYDDLGEGSVWRHLWPKAFELPISYAALRVSDLSAAEWAKVHVLHDPNLLRKASRAGFREARVAERLKDLEEATGRESARLNISALLRAATPERRGRGKRKTQRRGK